MNHKQNITENILLMSLKMLKVFFLKSLRLTLMKLLEANQEDLKILEVFFHSKESEKILMKKMIKILKMLEYLKQLLK